MTSALYISLSQSCRLKVGAGIAAKKTPKLVYYRLYLRAPEQLMHINNLQPFHASLLSCQVHLH